MPDDIGSYKVRNAAGTAVHLWPLTAGTSLAVAAPAVSTFPVGSGANPIVVSHFGLVDVVLLIPPEAPFVRTAVANPGLATTAAGVGVNLARVFAAALDPANPNDQFAQLTFAIDVGHATTPFLGTLQLELALTGGPQTLDIPLQVRPRGEENQLFIVLASIASRTRYTWLRARAVSSTAAAPVGAADVEIRALRDNAVVTGFNRSVAARTAPNGFVACRAIAGLQGNQLRSTVGVPVNWPVVFEFRAGGSVARAQMFEVTPAASAGLHNNNPHTTADVEILRLLDAQLSAQRFAFDPGHGVVYKDPALRCYEWFLAHRIAKRAAALLKERHGVLEANITFTRTAGLGMIDPGNVNSAAGPDTGELRYTYDMTNRTVQLRDATRTLTDISDLLLTRHQATPPFVATPVSIAERATILTENVATITVAIARTAAALSPARAPVLGSQIWEEPATPGARGRYVFQSTPLGAPTGARQTHEIRINTADRFNVTADKLRRIAARSARWSLNREGLSGTSAFVTRTRAAMLAEGALDYMTNAAFDEADKPSGHLFLAHGLKGWSFATRRNVLKALSPVPDITLTLHHNAVPTDGAGARGNAMLASHPTSATAAHLRLQKTFVKYVKGLGNGLREQGIVNNHGSALNGSGIGALISGYAFFENEFMNAGSADPAFQFEYERMVKPEFIERTAQEIVAALVEFLLSPQPNAEFDAVDVGKGISAGSVRW